MVAGAFERMRVGGTRDAHVARPLNARMIEVVSENAELQNRSTSSTYLYEADAATRLRDLGSMSDRCSSCVVRMSYDDRLRFCHLGLGNATR